MKVLEYIKEIEPVIHDSELEHVNRTATSDEILLEMLEHGSFITACWESNR
ncbi:MAG: hypothetical protein ACTSP4_17150 [Candidatus Hodarchaeales archaeon]